MNMRDIVQKAKQRRADLLALHLANPELTHRELGERFGGITSVRVGVMLKKAKADRENEVAR